jgi:hypothetical protein
MAAYNPRNFDLDQFMNDLFQQPDLQHSSNSWETTCKWLIHMLRLWNKN